MVIMWPSLEQPEKLTAEVNFCCTKTRLALVCHSQQGSAQQEENPQHCSTSQNTQASVKCKLYNALTLLVNSKIIQGCSVNVHTGKCTSGEGHVMGRPKNENFSATTINKESHNLDNCNWVATQLRVPSLTELYKVILSHGYNSFTLLSVRPQTNPWPNLAWYLRNYHEICSIML